MFGRNKVEKVKNVESVFIDGVEQTEADIPVYPGRDELMEPQVQQVPEQVPPLQIPPGVECPICFDFGFYADQGGVWHNCPRCNPVVEKKEVFANKGLEAIAKKKKGAKK